MTPQADQVRRPPRPLSPLAEAVEGFTGLAGWLTRELGGHAQAVARQIDGGSYTRDLAARDMTKWWALVASACVRGLNEVVDAAVVVAMPPAPNTYDVSVRLPRPFHEPCWLHLDGQVASHFDEPDVIPRTRVSLPNQLPAHQSELTIHIDATRLPGVNYWGRVVAVSQVNATDVQRVAFRVQVR